MERVRPFSKNHSTFPEQSLLKGCTKRRGTKEWTNRPHLSVVDQPKAIVSLDVNNLQNDINIRASSLSDRSTSVWK
jgi:hypothetical protein